MTKWTPEPWRVEKTDEGTYRVVDAQGKRVFSWNLPPAGEEVNRMVPCINALAGLNPEGVKELVESVEKAITVLKAREKEGIAAGGDKILELCLGTALAAVRLKDV